MTLRVEVVRSKKRRKTIAAHQVTDDLLRVSIPASLTKAEEQHWVEEMLKRFAKRALADKVDLERRAGELADQHGFPPRRRSAGSTTSTRAGAAARRSTGASGCRPG